MRTELMNTMSRTLHKVCFKAKKHSPEILIVAGAIGTVATVVMACKATLKVNDILDEAKTNVDKIHECVENEKTTKDGELYTQEVANQDLLIVYAQTGWKFVKLYGPAVALGVASMGCMIGSNVILRKRNIALAAAYTAVETGFKEYRGRVVDRFGKDMDRELLYNIKAKEIEETVTDEEGNETVVTKTVQTIDPNVAHDIYSVVYCEGSTGWTKSPDLNKAFLIAQQNAQGHWTASAPFQRYQLNFDNLTEPDSFATTLEGYVLRDDITPTQSGKTNANGFNTFLFFSIIHNPQYYY